MLSDDEIAEVKDAIAARLAAAELRHYDLSLYGIRISPADGAVMAVLIDQGETATLRSLLNQAVRPFIRPQQLKYPKPFIHVTL